MHGKFPQLAWLVYRWLLYIQICAWTWRIPAAGQKQSYLSVSDTMISQQVSHRLLSGGLFLIKAPRRRNGCHLRQTAVSTVTVEFSDGGWREASFERQTLTSFIVDREREREREREKERELDRVRERQKKLRVYWKEGDFLWTTESWDYTEWSGTHTHTHSHTHTHTHTHSTYLHTIHIHYI